MAILNLQDAILLVDKDLFYKNDIGSKRTISVEFYFLLYGNYLQQSFSLTNMDLKIFQNKLPVLCKKVILLFF